MLQGFLGTFNGSESSNCRNAATSFLDTYQWDIFTDIKFKHHRNRLVIRRVPFSDQLVPLDPNMYKYKNSVANWKSL